MTLPTTTRILIIFARNPREWLRGPELEDKFEMEPGSSSGALMHYRRKGYLAGERDPNDSRTMVYRIGPVLLREIGGGAVDGDTP